MFFFITSIISFYLETWCYDWKLNVIFILLLKVLVGSEDTL